MPHYLVYSTLTLCYIVYISSYPINTINKKKGKKFLNDSSNPPRQKNERGSRGTHICNSIIHLYTTIWRIIQTAIIHNMYISSRLFMEGVRIVYINFFKKCFWIWKFDFSLLNSYPNFRISVRVKLSTFLQFGLTITESKHTSLNLNVLLI